MPLEHGGDGVRLEVTELLVAWGNGDATAIQKLTPLVYAELKRIARRHMSRESGGHVLQATALVHEAYLRLVEQKRAQWHNRAQFFAVSAELMRRILVDMARARLTRRRGEDAPQLSLDEAPALSASEGFLALDEALSELERLDKRRGRVVELRYFGGLSVEETAEVLGVSNNTVLRDWKAAKAWLYRELSRSGSERP